MKTVWRYILWTVLILNIVPVCLFGAVFAWAYMQNGNAGNVDMSQPLFWLYVAVAAINWGLALLDFRKMVNSAHTLLTADGSLFQFNWKPVLLMFIVLNGIWVIYVLAYTRITAQWPSYSSLYDWQEIVFIGLFPISAILQKNCSGEFSSSRKWRLWDIIHAAPSSFPQSDFPLSMVSSSPTNWS